MSTKIIFRVYSHDILVDIIPEAADKGTVKISQPLSDIEIGPLHLQNESF